MNLIKQILQKMLEILGLMKKEAEIIPDQTLPSMTKPDSMIFSPQATTKIETWAKAIRIQEGNNAKDRNFKNCNPGNLKYTILTKELGAIGKDKDNFCIFKDYDAGFNALCEFLKLACDDKLLNYHSARTLRKFTKVYAQPPTGSKYAENVAKALKVSPEILISELK